MVWALVLLPRAGFSCAPFDVWRGWRGSRLSRLWPPSPSPRGAVSSLLWLLPSSFGRSVCAIAFGPDCDFFVAGPYILMNTKAFLSNVRTSKVKTVPSGET